MATVTLELFRFLQILLRGCQLRNTDWIVGLVLACGTETKVAFKRNPAEQLVKASHSDGLVNMQICGMCVHVIFAPKVVAFC